jgi:alanyl-tRNA synthetase
MTGNPPNMKTDELREKYLAFFETKGHTRCPSDVLVPTWDPSVLFTPAGMNQFKDHFLGKVKLEFTRATTCQKCLRTGDIDNVGRTAYHHTFFEMLGNFSFGDYFKQEAICWAWEFLTDKKWLGIEPERLSVTVYKDDHEAAKIWADQIHLPEARIERMEEDENFWPASAPSLGPDGVCGPCSEIYYHCSDGQQVEIWNLVFTQFNRVGAPPDNLRPLPSKNIDTGMGLERTASVLQGVTTNYHIDSLLPMVRAAAEVCGVKYDPESEDGRRLRRIADHVRACTFAVHENVYPGANKEKYVVKRLLRRAVLDGHQMGLERPFLYQLVPVVATAMRTGYPELSETVERVGSVIQQEEASFFETIDGGLNRIERVFDEMRSLGRVRVDGLAAADLYQTYGVPPELFEALAAEHNLTFDWDGYTQAMAVHGEASGKPQHTVMGSRGPIDTLKHALHSNEFLGYESLQAEATIKGIIAGNPPHELLCDQMDQAATDQSRADLVRVVLDQTPFYGESGGQVGDVGKIFGSTPEDGTPGNSGGDFEFEVTDTQRDGHLVVHFGHLLSGTMHEGARVRAVVDDDRRAGIRRAHSATHILHYSLQKIVGSHAQQQGSKVDDDWLRFDFTNLTAVDSDMLDAVEREVATKVRAGETIGWETLPLATARAQGAMMLFGEKYPDPVRMVSMGQFSKELCGGTHLVNTADIGAFEILSEEGISAGTRRITALTGRRATEHGCHVQAALLRTAAMIDLASPAAAGPADLCSSVQALLGQQKELKKVLASGGTLKDVQRGATGRQSAPAVSKPNDDSSSGYADMSTLESRQVLASIAKLLSVPALTVPDRIEAILQEVDNLKERLQERASAGPLTADRLLEGAEMVGGVTVVVAEAPTAAPNFMRQLIDQIRQKRSPSAVLLASSVGDSKVTLVAGVTNDLLARGAHAGHWVGPVAKALGGGGGGRADMAQAGGKMPNQLPAAMQIAHATIRQMIEG